MESGCFLLAASLAPPPFPALGQVPTTLGVVDRGPVPAAAVLWPHMEARQKVSKAGNVADPVR